MGNIVSQNGATAPAQRQSYEDFIPVRADDPELRGAIETLNNPVAINMIDVLEVTKKTDVANNAQFGLDGLRELSKLSASSPNWKKTPGAATATLAQRTQIINAAKETLQHTDVLNGMAGADRRIDSADMQKWLDYPEQVKFNQHIVKLSAPAAQRLMSALGSAPKTGIPVGQGISKTSIEQLSKLKPDSAAWNRLPGTGCLKTCART